MAKNNVTINGRTPVTKDSEGTFMGFPDVCKTPTPSGPVPVPCLNVAKSANLKNGSVSVKINGAPVCLEDSYLEPSTGDEAGSAGGIMSGKTRGKAEPLMYSFNVKIEGKCVVRNFDPFFCNDKNTLPVPIMQAQPAPLLAAAFASMDKREEAKCPYCNKKEPELAEIQSDSVGDSRKLETRLPARRDKTAHPWWAGAARSKRAT